MKTTISAYIGDHEPEMAIFNTLLANVFSNSSKYPMKNITQELRVTISVTKVKKDKNEKR